jgi:hypothetical protein
MPDEALITQMENILADVITLGGQNERSSVVPNLTVQDANPTGLSGFVIISDDRDGDNIVAKKVGSVIYTDNDLVNVLFPKGGEAIAFQQGSQSANSGIWEIVPSTTTDIFYDKGNVGIGKSVAPDAALEILDASQAQLRLTFEEDVKFVDFTLDTNHDLTITPSSNGQIILQPTTDSVDFFQVLDADGGDPVFNVDVVNERVAIGSAAPNRALLVEKDTTAVTVSAVPLITTRNINTSGNSLAGYEMAADNGAITGQFFADGNDLFGFGTDSIYFRVFTNHPLVFGTNNTARAIFEADGDFGLGTLTVPHGGVGAAKFAIDGANNSLAGPHIQITTDADDFPILQHFNWGHDNIGFAFDLYFDGQFRSADAGTNCLMRKLNDVFLIAYDSGIAQGNAVVLNTALSIDLATGAISVQDEINHLGDTDTKLVFGTDSLEATIGNLSMLKLTETAQDLVEIGDVAGTGDVDVSVNDEQIFLRGSDGTLGIGIASGSLEANTIVEIEEGGVKIAGGGFGDFVNASNYEIFFTSNGWFGRNTWNVQDIDFGGWWIDLLNNVTDTVDRFSIKYRAQSAAAGTFTTHLSMNKDGLLGINGITSPSTELDIGAGAMEFEEMTAPGAGAVNTARLFAQDNGAGKTQLAVRFNTGAIQILATEP